MDISKKLNTLLNSKDQLSDTVFSTELEKIASTYRKYIVEKELVNLGSESTASLRDLGCSIEKELNSRRTSIYGRKYIEDLGIDFVETPQGFNTDISSESRFDRWVEQRRTFGFDERETWSLDYTICLWLYERIKMFDQINKIDTETCSFEHKGKSISLQECIDRMLEGFRLRITKDLSCTNDELDKIDEAFELLAICWKALWW